MHRLIILSIGFLFTLSLGTQVEAQMYINELFFDPGGGANDFRDEFIELRGDAGASLAGHYLIFLENELDEFGQGDAGVIENIFDLGIADNGSAATFGSNGFLTLQQKFNRYSGDQVSPLATQLVNDGPNLNGSFPGFGNDANEGSTIGASDLSSSGNLPVTGATENSGFTAMLIRNDSGSVPVLGDDLDVGNDGLDLATGQAGWTILDSIGVFGEASETEFGRLYGQVNFGVDDPTFGLPPEWTPNIEPGTEFELLLHEIEYLGRWGNSTGQSTDDWHASNLTDNAGSGSAGVNGHIGPVDLRQSGDPHPSNDGNLATPATQPSFIESSQGVPYGTKLLTNIGAPNYMTGDYNNDGYVDAADYTVWRDTEGIAGTELDHPLADANHDFLVDSSDYDSWVANFGSPNGSSNANSTTVPEPNTAALLLIVGSSLASFSRRGR